MTEEMERPQCGGAGIVADEYDLPLHVAAVFIVLGASVIGCGFPVVAKKVPWMKIPPKVFFFCKHFGTGVLIATAFVHLVPVAFGSLTNPCLPPFFTDQYPALPGVIMMMSLFALFIMEMWLNAKTGGHSHGGPTGVNHHGAHHGQPHHHDAHRNLPISAPIRSDEETYKAFDFKDDDKAFVREYPVAVTPPTGGMRDMRDMQSQMPPWFVVFYEQYVRQRDEIIDMVNRNMPAMPRYGSTSPAATLNEYDGSDEETAVSPEVLRKMNLNITLLEGGILFHSIFVGMTISVTTEGFIVLLVAIVFHQMFEGLGLGSRIAEVPYPKRSIRPWVLVFAFGTTAPIGQAIGLATRNTYDPDSAIGLILVGVFNAISSGLLIYAALVDLLHEDFLSEEANRLMRGKDKAIAFGFLFLGAAGMSIVGAFA